MRICINAASANQGGAVTYLTNVLPELSALRAEDRFLVIAPGETLDRLGAVLSTPAFDAETYAHPPARQVRRLHFDQLRVPALARRFRADVLFSSNGFGSPLCRSPEALLVRNPRYFSPLLQERLRERGASTSGLRLRRAWSLLSIRGAQAVLFPTRAMQEMVGGYASLGRKRSRVLRYGFDRGRFFSGESPADPVLAPMRAWREAGRRVLLYVSGYATHKNFETAIEALASLRAKGSDAGLVLTASRRHLGDMVEPFEAMLARIGELGLEDAVHIAGQVPWSQLHAVYAAADVFLFPSFLESFGHPMVEAMASGLPSVAADTPVNREVLGEAALYFDVFDAEACARAVGRVLEDAPCAQGLHRAALERSRLFSWRTHASGLRELLAELAPGAG